MHRLYHVFLFAETHACMCTLFVFVLIGSITYKNMLSRKFLWFLCCAFSLFVKYCFPLSRHPFECQFGSGTLNFVVSVYCSLLLMCDSAAFMVVNILVHWIDQITILTQISSASHIVQYCFFSQQIYMSIILEKKL